jgi:hypothetical protein
LRFANASIDLGVYPAMYRRSSHTVAELPARELGLDRADFFLGISVVFLLGYGGASMTANGLSWGGRSLYIGSYSAVVHEQCGTRLACNSSGSSYKERRHPARQMIRSHECAPSFES